MILTDFCKDRLYFPLENAKLKDYFYFFKTKVHPLVLRPWRRSQSVRDSAKGLERERKVLFAIAYASDC